MNNYNFKGLIVIFWQSKLCKILPEQMMITEIVFECKKKNYQEMAVEYCRKINSFHGITNNQKVTTVLEFMKFKN